MSLRWSMARNGYAQKIAVVDRSLARSNGLRWTGQLRAGDHDLKVIVLSVYDEPTAAVRVGKEYLSTGISGRMVPESREASDG